MKSRLAAFLVVACASCRGGSDTMGGLSEEAFGCEQAAEIEFDLRAAAGDYPRNEGKKRADATRDDFKNSCASESKTNDCCAAAQRLSDRLAGHKVANCTDLFTRLAATGCTVR